MKSSTVLVTWNGFAEPGLTLLRDAGCDVVLLTDTVDKAEVDRILRSHPIDVVISRTVELDAEALRSCPTLRGISKHGAGVNNIDLDAATQLGLPVTRTPGANAPAVAELTIGLMLSAARRIPWLTNEVKQGRWTRTQDGVELGGKTLGLLGFGQVGARVAQVAKALGLRVRAFDPALDATRPPADVEVCPTVTDLLQGTDVLSLHVPLSEHTRGMIGRAELAQLADRAILVNTARGPVVNEDALVEALRSGALGAAALDTLAVEPVLPNNPLLSLENVVLTPHVGGSTTAAVSAVGAAAARNALSLLNGTAIDQLDLANPQVTAHPGR